MTISVVLPNYNGVSLLETNFPVLIGNLQQYLGYDFEVIVVDDASEDGSAEWVENFFKKKKPINITYILLQNKKNHGFSHTANEGIQKATGEFVVLLNTDISPKSNFLEPALAHFSNQKVFAVGFMDESIENSSVMYRGRGLGKWERGFYFHSRGEVDKSDTAWVSGGSGIFRRSMLEILGGFDEIYDPFYWEDIDLSYRAKKRGYSLVFEPKSVVVHSHSKGAILSRFSQQDIKKISYRNQFLFVWKNATPTRLINHFVWLPYHILKATVRRDYLFILGFFWAVGRFFSYRFK